MYENTYIEQSPRHSEVAAAAGGVATAAMFSEVMPQPKANLYLAIGNAPRNPNSGIIEPTEEQRTEIIRALSEFSGAMSASMYAEEDVAEGVGRAKRLVQSGESQDYLSQLRMMFRPEHATEEFKPLHISMGGELAVDPRYVVGVGSLNNWQGVRYDNAGNLVTKHEEGVETFAPRPSYKVIDDYATRDTQLPPTSYAEVFLTSDGMLVYTHDSHRVAAAQLRHEPVRLQDIALYDYRNKEASMLTQLELAEGLRIVEHNSDIR